MLQGTLSMGATTSDSAGGQADTVGEPAEASG